ncbi:MAG: S-layer homology domain-containing protein, partial [Thermosynechococcaceae cyanobacterium]
MKRLLMSSWSSLFIVLAFMVGGCSPKAEQATTSPGDESVFSKGASSASETPESQPSETPTPEDSAPSTQPTAAEEIAELTDLTDVPTQAFIVELNKLGVFEQTEGTFKPYEPITRGEYLIWMFKANNAIARADKQLRFDPTFNPGFTDISPEHPAYKYVQAFANGGYAVGYEDKTFRPDQPLTREEMIALKVGLDSGEAIKPLKDTRSITYADAAQVESRYTGYIRGDGSFKNAARAFGAVKDLKPKQVVKRY